MPYAKYQYSSAYINKNYLNSIKGTVLQKWNGMLTRESTFMSLSKHQEKMQNSTNMSFSKHQQKT